MANLDMLWQLAAGVHNAVQNNPGSLTQLTKNAQAISRLYIDKSLVHHEDMNGIITMFANMYMSLVSNGLGLNNYIAGGRMLKDVRATVATEAFVDSVQLFETQFGDPIAEDDPRMQGVVTAMEAVDDSKSLAFPTARWMNVKINIPGGEDGKVISTSVSVLINLVPYVIDEKVLKGFMTLNFKDPFMRRYAMWKAKEISFWTGLVRGAHREKEKKKALLEDKSGVLKDMLDHTNSRMGQHFASIASSALNGTPGKNNLANSIMLVDKANFTEVMTEAQYDWKNPAERLKFFSKSMCMIVAIMDDLNGMLTLYMNGYDNPMTYPLALIKQKTAKPNGIDVKELIKAMATQQPVRL